MNLDQQLIAAIDAQYADVVAIRRDLHMHPETGFEVDRTAGIVAAEMRKLGLSVSTGIGKTGVYADLSVPGARKTIALRADMDALPMQELGNPPYKSRVDGKAHMCGHDSHTAMLIGAARILKTLAGQLAVNVRFIFQPNEENLPGGAPAMIADGVLEGVDHIFGLHVWPYVDTGHFSVCQGPALGQPDVFELTITGRGGHAAMPHQTIDPIVIGAQFVSEAQTLVSRCVNPLQSAVVSVTQFHGGSTHNVIPDRVTISGTVRTFDADVKKMLSQGLKEKAAAICQANQAKMQWQYTDGYPVCYNHEAVVPEVLAAIRKISCEEKLNWPAPPTLGGEDFAYYAEKVPGCFVFVGCRNEAENKIYPLHDPRFDIDETCMKYGMALHVMLALNRP